MSPELKKTYDLIADVVEVDYGDFKRRVASKINNFLENCEDPKERQLAQKTKEYVLYYFDPNKEQLEIRHEILQLLNS